MFAIISSASINQDRAELRRWSFSAMLAVAVHGVAAMAVLAWHITSKPIDADVSPAPGPFFIDLVPPPTSRSSEQHLRPPEPGLDRGDATSERGDGAAEARSAVNRDTGTVSFGLQRNEAGPGANDLAAEAPIVPARPDSAQPDAGGASTAASDAFAASHINGSPADVSRVGGVDPGPLDTSITASPSLHQRQAFGAFGRNRMMLLRPSTYPGKTEPTHNSLRAFANAPVAHGVSGQGSVTHGPGAHVQDRVSALRRAERARNGGAAPAPNTLGINNPTSSGVHDNVKNAIGAAPANGSIGNPKSGAINGTTVRNAVGMIVEVHPGAHGIGGVDPHSGGNPNGLKTGVSPSSTGFTVAAPPTGILNGRGFVRPGTSLTALGGPPKSAPGSLNGSDFHSKHQ